MKIHTVEYRRMVFGKESSEVGKRDWNADGLRDEKAPCRWAARGLKRDLRTGFISQNEAACRNAGRCRAR